MTCHPIMVMFKRLNSHWAGELGWVGHSWLGSGSRFSGVLEESSPLHRAGSSGAQSKYQGECEQDDRGPATAPRKGAKSDRTPAAPKIGIAIGLQTGQAMATAPVSPPRPVCSL